MVAVATVGLILGVANLARRRKHFQYIALRHEVTAMLAGRGCSNRAADSDLVRYHEALKLKYREAADHPWRSVETTPPPP